MKAGTLLQQVMSVVGLKSKVKVTKLPSKNFYSSDEERIGRGARNVRDYLAPNPVDFSPLDYRKVGDYYIKTLFVWKYPEKLNNNHLEDLFYQPFDNTITIHQVPINSEYFVTYLSTRINKNKRLKSMLEARNRSDGYINQQIIMDEKLRDELISGKERSYSVGIYIDVYAKSLDQLEKNVDAMMRAVGRRGMTCYNADGQNEDAFYSTLPIMVDRLQHYHNMTTSNIADLFPISSSTLSMDTGVYYGKNKGDNSMILLDRFKMKNPNMAIIAPSGSGKTTLMKQEAILYRITKKARVFFLDRENETVKLTERMKGLFLDYSKRSNIRVNPCDLRASDDDKFDYFDRKVEFLINLFRKMAGGLTTKERSLLARCIRKAYAVKGFTEDYATLFTDVQHGEETNIRITNRKLRPLTDMPILSDIDHECKQYQELDDLRDRVAYFLEEGPGKIINAHSNIDIRQFKWVSFGLRNLSDETRPVIIWTILDFIENTIKENADKPKELREKILVNTVESWSIMNNDEEAEYFYEYSKRCRKYGGALTTEVQNILDYDRDSKGFGIEILNNTSMVIVLSIGQKGTGVNGLKEKLGLNDSVIKSLQTSETGAGYIITDENRAEFYLEPIPEFKDFIFTTPFEDRNNDTGHSQKLS